MLSTKIVMIFILLFVAFKENVGGDWLNYLNHLKQAEVLSVKQILTNLEGFYWISVYYSQKIFKNIYFLFFICGALFCYGLYKFSITLRNPLIAIIIAFPYFITVVALGYVKQSAAIGLILLAYYVYQKGKLKTCIVILLLAVNFHVSAIITFIPFSFLFFKNKLALLFTTLIFFLAFYYNIFSESFTYVQSSYLDRNYSSSGSVVRVFMNLLPALIIIKKRKELLKINRNNQMILYMSIFTLFLFFGLFVISATTIIDRLNLFFIPIQLYFFANIEVILKRFNLSLSHAFLISFFYSFIVLIYWIFYSTHYSYWDNYTNFLISY